MIAGLRLGHINIRATSLETTVAWYERVLGLRRAVSDTNPDTSVNLWLYDAGGSPCVHVNQLAPGDIRTAKGHLDHFAFDVVDRAATEAHLTDIGVPFETVPFPHARMVQLNLRDPDGVKVELTFRNQG
jgi:catechol 2,3-dioxygenase-like lactoylglutathione lyase family enzyme